MKRLLLALGLLIALALAGCGGGAKTVQVCSGTTDTCVKAPLSTVRHFALFGAPGGCKIVDVSDYQGTVDWGRAKPYICGGITKAGEGGSYAAGGSQFRRNWTTLRALHLWHSAYWFLRGSAGCQTQASLIILRLNSVGYAHDPLAGNFQLDVEVPGANDGGLAVCVSGRIWATFHRHTDIYTSPGTYPGGSHGSDALWQATYGGTFAPLWRPVVAWQCTDGVHGCIYYVPGIGYGDVSINYGMLSEHPAAPPRLRCFGKHAHKRNATCKRVRRDVARWTRARDSSHGAYLARACDVLAGRDAWFAARVKQRGRRQAYRRRALAATRSAERSRSCSVFAGRVTYFQRRITVAVSTY